MAHKSQYLELLLLVGVTVVVVCTCYFGPECAEPMTTAVFLVLAKWICLSFSATFLRERWLILIIGTLFTILESFYAYDIFDLIGSSCNSNGFAIIIFVMLCTDILITLILQGTRKRENAELTIKERLLNDVRNRKRVHLV
mmetsp:Transcript_44187/g.50851  ORF Transcript_44187/g.50851 Transcript_44187/m.50851 type:complete len:141 (-) Transcript_44187:724-1146(-)